MELRALDELLWELPAGARDDMRVPARVFADEELMRAIRTDRSLEQLQNVATLPGIVDAALAMPDIHAGYGFPVGTVAATELPDGVVSREEERKVSRCSRPAGPGRPRGTAGSKPARRPARDPAGSSGAGSP